MKDIFDKYKDLDPEMDQIKSLVQDLRTKWKELQEINAKLEKHGVNVGIKNDSFLSLTPLSFLLSNAKIADIYISKKL